MAKNIIDWQPSPASYIIVACYAWKGLGKSATFKKGKYRTVCPQALLKEK